MIGRNAYLVAYDVCDPKRLRKVFKKMKGHGDPLQLSLFRCALTALQRERLISDLMEIVELEEDRVLIVDLGPASGVRERAFRFLGRPLKDVDDGPFVF